MTEEQWVRASDREIRDAVFALDPRRQRLLAVAICRAMGRWVNYPAVHNALSAVETFADTGKTKAALRRARQAVQALREELLRKSSADPGMWLTLFTVQMAASENAVFGTLEQARRSLAIAEGISSEAAQRYLHAPYWEVAGNPFRPGAFPPEWRTSTAVALAKQMYESRDFSAMPILADALQDAGCDNEDVLNHCRDSEQAHVRGCWVVDLVLGKS
jgi:hypothetical protein